MEGGIEIREESVYDGGVQTILRFASFMAPDSKEFFFKKKWGSFGASDGTKRGIFISRCSKEIKNGKDWFFLCQLRALHTKRSTHSQAILFFFFKKIAWLAVLYPHGMAIMYTSNNILRRLNPYPSSRRWPCRTIAVI